VPVGQGRPGEGYPWFWEIHTWVEGETVPVPEIDAIQAARDLAALVRALQGIEPTDGPPPGRGVALAERDPAFHDWMARVQALPALAAPTTANTTRLSNAAETWLARARSERG